MYVRPGASLRKFRTVMFDSLVVVTDPDWLPTRDIVTGSIREQHPVSNDELRHIENTLEPAVRRIYVEELAAAGYLTTAEARDDTLRVSVWLADVFINTAGFVTGSRASQPDTMTLVTNLADARTGQTMARLLDRKRGRMGTLETPNDVANDLYFRRAIRDSAERLRESLDRMSRDPGQQQAASR